MPGSNKSSQKRGTQGAFRKTRGAAKQKRPTTQDRRDGSKTGTRPDANKTETMMALLRRPDGASIAELCKATGWQAHSVRGALSGTLKKKLGLTIKSVKGDGIRTYRIVK